MALTGAFPTPDPASRAAFDAVARAEGLDPADRWVGGYVAYEWAHLRPLLAAYGIALEGQRALEFGCNVGGSAVVLAQLGADVAAIDIDRSFVRVARANAQLHGVEDSVDIAHVADTRSLPFADAQFDFALANSVLEYVHPDRLPGVVGELHRVLRPGGHLLVCGTSNRLAPREMHSRRWGVNYLPRAIAPDAARGLAPWQLARLARGRFAVEGADRWLDARAAIHGQAGPAKRALAAAAGLFGTHPGWISPSLEVLLRKL